MSAGTVAAVADSASYMDLRSRGETMSADYAEDEDDGSE